jgi:murein L,D-transpeptidase YcbB/YkuD
MPSPRALKLVALAAGLSCSGHAPAADAEREDALRPHIEAALAASPGGAVLGEPLREREALARFYASRAHRPAWLEEGAGRARVAALLEAVRGAERDGLRPEAYHAAALEAQLPRMQAESAARRAQLDLLLSDAFLHLAQHLARGAVDPRRLHPRYERRDEPHDGPAVLGEALRTGAVAEALARLAPPHPEYAALRGALERLRAVAAAGGWPPVPEGAQVAPGACAPRVVALRSRLSSPRALPAGGDPACLDPALADALESFQQRHGLPSDGVLGARSSAALNVTAAQRVEQVRANLERWRWLPAELGRRHLRVNAAAFTLQAFEAEVPALEMRVVVGCPGWKTPLVHGDITHLVLNPAWDVPRSIAVREMLPRARRDAGYFSRQGIEVLEKAGDGAAPRAVSPASVNWSAVSAADFPYRLRQPPGPRNPLGRIKFLFENPFGIYLHGTPGRSALALPVRALSHGCVRVEDEIALALFALAPAPEWSEAGLRAALETARERRVPLPEPLPVHVVYLSAGVAADAAPTFAEDPYGWDPPLIRLLGPEGDAGTAAEGSSLGQSAPSRAGS